MSANTKLAPTKPYLLLLYGFQGSGKTYFARQLADHIQTAHLQADRIRSELFEQPGYTKQENAIVLQLMDYMTEEFLKAGMSVVYDANVMRSAQRRNLRALARKCGAETVQVWQQIDPEAAVARAVKRDRRKMDDRYSRQLDVTTFKQLASGMQNPSAAEEYIVTSGKHVFSTQFNAVLRHLYQRGIIVRDNRGEKVAMPGLVNLVPNPQAGRVDMSRRNITIR
jgi:predicted kinase